MELFILKTEIKNRAGLKSISPILNQHPEVNRWTIDLEDIDKVLRIEASEEAKEIEILDLLNTSGIKCDTLPD